MSDEIIIPDLPSPSDVAKARRSAEKKFSHLTQEQIRHLRRLCKKNNFFLCTSLGYISLNNSYHRDSVCRWVDETKGRQYRLKLDPRGHFKSTIFTTTDCIQTALPDDDGDSPYPYSLGPDVRILIAHEIDKMAQRFLYGITQHFMTNEVLVGLFPECIPDPKKQRINQAEMQLPRNVTFNEPTFDTIGLGGRGQGRHYNKLKLDDIIGDKARDSQTEMENAILWFDNILSFYDDPSRDQLDITGTRWSLDDVYAHAMEVYGDQLAVYTRSVEEIDKDIKSPTYGKKVPIFPERFPPKTLEILRKNKKVWLAQYMNDPQSGATEFSPDWLKFFKWGNFTQKGIYNTLSSRVRFGELSNGQYRIDKAVGDLDRVIFIDPAITGDLGYVITGTDEQSNIFTLDEFGGVMTPPEMVNRLFRDVQKWQPRLVCIEEVLFSKLYEFYLQAEMKLRRIFFNVEPIKIGNKQKPIRVRGLSNFFASGKIFFHESQEGLIEEFKAFGATATYHRLDAMSMGIGVWRAAVSKNTLDKQREAEERLLSQMDLTTGYSAMR